MYRTHHDNYSANLLFLSAFGAQVAQVFIWKLPPLLNFFLPDLSQNTENKRNTSTKRSIWHVRLGKLMRGEDLGIHCWDTNLKYTVVQGQLNVLKGTVQPKLTPHTFTTHHIHINHSGASLTGTVPPSGPI